MDHESYPTEISVEIRAAKKTDLFTTKDICKAAKTLSKVTDLKETRAQAISILNDVKSEFLNIINDLIDREAEASSEDK